MPWRLIVIIIIFAVLLGFIGLNLTNTCDISLGFKVFKGVPVYLTVFASFMLGMVTSLPFFIFGSLKKKLKKEKQSKTQVAENPQVAPETASIPATSAKSSKLKGFFKKKTDTSKTEKIDENGPYGID